MKKPTIRATDLPAARIQNLSKIRTSLRENKALRPAPLAAAAIAPFVFGEDIYNAGISLLIGAAAYAATYIYGPMLKARALALFNNVRHGQTKNKTTEEDADQTDPDENSESAEFHPKDGTPPPAA